MTVIDAIHRISGQKGGLYRMLVTPEQARKWLDAAGTNRRLSRRIVNEIIRDLVAGDYDETVVNPIRLNSAGAVTDGQHRLTAISESGVSVRLWVEETESIYIDRNRPRSNADTLVMRGDGAYAPCRASAMRVVMACERDRQNGSEWNMTSAIMPQCSPAEMFARLHGNARFTELVAMAMDSYSAQPRFGRVFGPAAAAALLYFCETDIADARFGKTMLDRLASGDGLQEGEPAFAYRRFAMSVDSKIRHRGDFAGLMFVARQTLAGNTVKMVRVSSLGDVSKLTKKAVTR